MGLRPQDAKFRSSDSALRAPGFALFPAEPKPQAADSGLQTLSSPVCVKRSHTRCVLTFAVRDLDGAAVQVFAKRCRARDVLKRLASLFRSSKARREWETAWEALRRGIATAAPLAWAERRRWGMMTENYLVTREIEEALSFRALWGTLAAPEERREWLERLARFIRNGHDRGFAHDDLSADHVLVQWGSAKDWNSAESEAASAPRFFFIDLDNAHLAARVGSYRRAHNFFQVFRSLGKQPPSEAETAAFLRAYSGGQWGDRKIRGVLRAVRRIARAKRLGKLLSLGRSRR